tara:strand:- start:113 stop:370 length:258 start_codon:yes stop_codon:yes gene_type:complete
MSIAEEMTFPLCLTSMILSVIICLGYYHVNDRKLMSQNIEAAIAKGVDPISVRCSYASRDDIICIAFATSQSHYVPTQISTTNKK